MKDDETRIYRWKDRDQDGQARADQDGIGYEKERSSTYKKSRSTDRDFDREAYEQAQYQRYLKTRRRREDGGKRRKSDRSRFENRGKTSSKTKYGPSYERQRPTDSGRVKPKKKKKKGCFGRAILIILLVLVLGLTYFVLRIKAFDAKNAEKPVVNQAQGNSLAPIEDDILFLLAGVDDTGAGTPQRTDTLMLVRLNFEEGQVSILSVPRDSRAYVGGNLDKINHAHAYGGIEMTLETLRGFLNLDLDYYIKVDYDMVKSMIDAGGGVDYDVPENLTPKAWEKFELGPHRLDGEESLSYLRHRKSYATGDIGRVQAQQAFLKEAMKQIFSPSNFFHYPALLNTFLKKADTNIPMASLLAKGPALFRLRSNEVDFHTLPGEGVYINGISYYQVYPQESLNLVAQLFGPYYMY